MSKIKYVLQVQALPMREVYPQVSYIQKSIQFPTIKCSQMRVPSDRFHTRSPLNSEFTPRNENTVLSSDSFQNMIKVHLCPAAGLL